MSAVSIQAPLPHYEEALAYWDDFTVQCRRHVKAINACIFENQLPEEQGVTFTAGPRGVSITRGYYPSTEVKMRLEFEHWGPKICVSVRGDQDPDLRFYPEDYEFTVATDMDDQMIAIITEGRSLTAHEFAKYVAQNFRRCYPGLSLPCPEHPFN